MYLAQGRHLEQNLVTNHPSDPIDLAYLPSLQDPSPEVVSLKYEMNQLLIRILSLTNHRTKILTLTLFY